MDVSKPRTISRDDLIAGIAALPIGVVAGVTGVGGGEYRAPVLLSLLRNVRYTIAGNLLAGVLVGISTALLRGAFVQPLDTMLLAATMVVGSLPGAYGGAILARRTPSRWLKGRLAGILGVVGIAGVGLGVALLQRTTNATVTKILASLMLLAAAQIAWEIRSPDVMEESGTRPGSSSRDPEPYAPFRRMSTGHFASLTIRSSTGPRANFRSPPVEVARIMSKEASALSRRASDSHRAERL